MKAINVHRLSQHECHFGASLIFQIDASEVAAKTTQRISLDCMFCFLLGDSAYKGIAIDG
jgi:hypothetical protein